MILTSRAFALPRNTELRARSDLSGFIVVWPDGRSYRSVPQGAVRALARAGLSPDLAERFARIASSHLGPASSAADLAGADDLQEHLLAELEKRTAALDVTRLAVLGVRVVLGGADAGVTLSDVNVEKTKGSITLTNVTTDSDVKIIENPEGDVSIAGLVREAAVRALEDAGLGWADIDAVVFDVDQAPIEIQGRLFGGELGVDLLEPQQSVE